MDNHKVLVVFRASRTNFVDLPSSITQILNNANIYAQDVIVEIATANSKVYAGWSGLNAAAFGTIEVDPVYAESVGLVEKASVTVSVKTDFYTSRNISLEPETSSDWELVELHAASLEQTLINQARCVALNQPVVVFPSKTTAVKLVVKDLGSASHTYAKIDPFCEIAVAPKLKERKALVARSTRSSRSVRLGVEDYSHVPLVMKRGIALPHGIFADLPQHADPDGYEVYLNFSEVISTFNKAEFVAVLIVPGPNHKINTVEPQQDKEKFHVPLKENKRIIARVVDYAAPTNTVGLSRKLAVALNVENVTGFITVIKPAVKHLAKKPATFVVHPYIVQTKKASVSVNSHEKKDRESLLTESLTKILYSQKFPLTPAPVTNYTKLPIIPGVLPHGGLLKFKRNDETTGWTRLCDAENKKISKIELGDDLLRNASFLEEPVPNEQLEAIGLEKTVSSLVLSITTFRNSGSLVHGNAGSGKTLVLKLAARQLSHAHGYHTKIVSCEHLMNESFTNLSAHFRKWVQECSWHKPSVLVLDNLDKLLTAEQEHMDSSQLKQLTEFFVSQMQKVHAQANSNVAVLASGLTKEAFNGYLFQSHLVENYVHLSAPDKSMRQQILQGYLEEKLECSVDFDIMDLVSETEGYLPNDLKTLCDRIYHETIFRSEDDKKVSKDIMTKALDGFTPANLRGVKLQKSSTNWSDIGGLTEAKNIMLETLEWPTRYAPIFASCPLRLRSGILLYGYPGCGKTLLASAIAGQCGLNFISIKGPEILNKYIGASEQSVRELFERAQSAKPCILFFDEFDSIAPKRGHDSTGVTDRVVNQMLTQMDGAEGLDGVYVLAATSRPDLIDSALLRPGRLDKSVICDMPNFDDRLDILKTVTAKMDLADDVDLHHVAHQTAGFSGADMQGLTYNAYLKAVHTKLTNDESALEGKATTSKKAHDFFQVNSEELSNIKMRPADRVKLAQQIEQLFTEDSAPKTTTSQAQSTPLTITHAHFEESLKETKPSISASEKQKLDRVYQQFVSGRDGNMPDGTASSEIGGRTTLM